MYLVGYTTQLNLHLLKINHAAKHIKETLTMCLEILAHSLNLQCLHVSVL